MSDKILLPKKLTADNGSKALLIGEFHETLNIDCPTCYGDGCKDCLNQGFHIVKVQVSWTTIKNIYKKIVEFHHNEAK